MTNDELRKLYTKNELIIGTSLIPAVGLVRLGYVGLPQWVIDHDEPLLITVDQSIKDFLLGVPNKLHENAYSLLEHGHRELPWSSLEEEAVVNDLAFEINRLRKESGFDISDRVTVHLNKCGWDVGYAVYKHLDSLLKRTISSDVLFNTSDEGREIIVGGIIQDTKVLLKVV